MNEVPWQAISVVVALAGALIGFGLYFIRKIENVEKEANARIDKVGADAAIERNKIRDDMAAHKLLSAQVYMTRTDARDAENRMAVSLAVEVTHINQRINDRLPKKE